MENNTVKVVRYIRPENFGWDFMENSNLYGITIIFELDHEARDVTASFSICNGDNFSREVGKYLAETSNAVVTFDMDDIDTYGGLIFALTNRLNQLFLEDSGIFLDYTWDYFKEYLDLYLLAHRKLSGK